MICPECRGEGCVLCNWSGWLDDDGDTPDPTGGDNFDW